MASRTISIDLDRLMIYVAMVAAIFAYLRADTGADQTRKLNRQVRALARQSDDLDEEAMNAASNGRLLTPSHHAVGSTDHSWHDEEDDEEDPDE